MRDFPGDRPLEGLYRRALGRDNTNTLLHVTAFVAVYVVIDMVIDRWSQAPGHVYLESSLVWGAITEQLPSTLALGAFGLAALYVGRSRLWCRWADLELGGALRYFAIPLIALLVWRSAFYEYHFVYDQWHAVDRVLVAALGIAAIVRPIFVLPFVIQVSVVSWQFPVLLGTTAAANIDAPASAALLAVGLAVVAHVVVEIRAGQTALWLSGVVTAAWFFLPGRNKLRIGWHATEPADFARTSEIAGWLADTGGGFNGFMVDFLSTFRWPVLAITLVLEVGAVVAVSSRRSMLWWLPGWIVFHIVIFASSGFWLFPWVVLEAGLFVAYRRTDVAAAFDTVGGPARSGFAVALVLLGAQLFDPAGLAWIDSPVGQAYEVEVVGTDGTRYNVPISAFEPVGIEVSFMTIGAEDPLPAVGAYGALGSEWERATLAAITSFEGFDEYRHEFGSPESMQAFYGERLLLTWFDHANASGDPAWFLASPPPRVWTARPALVYDWQPISRLELIRVDALHRHDDIRRTVVLTVEAGADGHAVVVPSADS